MVSLAGLYLLRLLVIHVSKRVTLEVIKYLRPFWNASCLAEVVALKS